MGILEARIDDIHRLYRAGELTPVQLVDFYLARADALDLQTGDGPPFNCIVCVSPSVRRDAAAATDEIARTGVVGPLHGIPVWIKDNLDVRGLPTTGGSLALEDGIAPADAALVSHLRSAGAIVMGKAAMTELAIGTSEYSTISGRVGNAIDPRNPPSGSSHGSAVAVSLNFGMLAVGVDDAGSITDPAAINSCVGLRPTPGLIERAGLLSSSETETTPGPIARTVIDAAKMLEALAGPSAWGRYSEPLARASIRGRRIGVLAGAGPVDFMADVATPIKQQFARCLAALEAEGATIVRGVRVDGLIWRRQSMYEHYNWQIASLRARQTYPRTPRQLFSSPAAAPLVRQLGRHPLLRFGPPVRVPNIHARSYRRFVHHNKKVFTHVLTDARVEAVLTVTTLSPSRISTLAQLPHLTVPGGSVEANDELVARGFVRGSTVPWGVSILGAPGAECPLLMLGHAVEQIVDGRVRPRHDAAIAAASAGREVDIAALNELKKAIAHRCAGTLRLDERGRYLHPTAEEFRSIVRGVTAGRSHPRDVVVTT